MTSVQSELSMSRRENLELHWELYWQKSHLLLTLQELVKQKSEKCLEWRKQQIHYMIDYLDTINLKLISIEEKCLKQMYDNEHSQALEALSKELDNRIEKAQAQKETALIELEALQNLPKELVEEYFRVNEKINNCHEYFERLET
mmetsp:Transcript_8603/g.10332  ORF Transcript_8603/g.10332 Transcript_8603/m.10332 type:complete len:145 (-) Transcript_8603:716-1150(-)